VLKELLEVGVADEQSFHLPQKIAGAERLDEQRVGAFSGPILFVPIFAGGRISGEQGGRGIVGLAARRAQDFQSGLFGFHAQVADDHVVNAGLQAGKGFGGTAGGFDFKSVQFEYRFEGQQDGEIVVDKKNTAFHVTSSCWSWRCSALRSQLTRSVSRSIHSFSIEVWLAST
jgi:hypothetical protein